MEYKQYKYDSDALLTEPAIKVQTMGVERFAIEELFRYEYGKEVAAIAIKRKLGDGLQKFMHVEFSQGPTPSHYRVRAFIYLPYVYDHKLREAKNETATYRENYIRTRNRLDRFNDLPWYKRIFKKA